MNTGGEAADQIVRMSLNGVEVAAKVSGVAAKQIAVMIYAIMKEQKKTKGKVRLESLVRSGKPLTVFSVKQSDLQKFTQEAKKYGILYCAIRNTRRNADGMIDIMVKEEDAIRINRIVERFEFSSVTKSETATVKADIEKAKSEKQRIRKEKDDPIKNNNDQLLDDLFATPLQKGTNNVNPKMATMGKTPQSEPSLKKQSKTDRGTSNSLKPSVREELNEIKAVQKKESEAPKLEEKKPNKKLDKNNVTMHQQPKRSRKKSEKVR